MSLYTFSPTENNSSVKVPQGFRAESSTDIKLLSILGNSSIGEVRHRLANDNRAFIAYLNNQPAAFGWMAVDAARIGELKHNLILPEGHRYLWNFRTFEAFRGQGVYPTLLQFILQQGDRKANRFWIIHAPENAASLKGIRKAGFEYVGKLYIDSNDFVMIDENESSLAYQEQLEYMDIRLSGEKSRSCWNCSSPYLKKRNAVCCCKPVGEDCIGYNLPALI